METGSRLGSGKCAEFGLARSIQLSAYLCLCFKSLSTCPRRQLTAGMGAFHHLHSTATGFCVGDAEGGLIPVSDEPGDVDAVVCETVQKRKINKYKKLEKKSASLVVFKSRCQNSVTAAHNSCIQNFF